MPFQGPPGLAGRLGWQRMGTCLLVPCPGALARRRGALRPGSYTVVAIGRAFEEVEVILCANHRPRVAGQADHGEGAKDGVDGAALEPELAQVAAGEERARGCE